MNGIVLQVVIPVSFGCQTASIDTSSGKMSLLNASWSDSSVIDGSGLDSMTGQASGSKMHGPDRLILKMLIAKSCGSQTTPGKA